MVIHTEFTMWCMHPQDDDSNWQQPYDDSPVSVPAGWSGGQVWHTGGGIWMRSWYNAPDGRPNPNDTDAPDEYIEVGYNGDMLGVSAQLYELRDRVYAHVDLLEERGAGDDVTDEELAEMARELMEALDE